MLCICLDCGEQFYVEETDELDVCPYCWSKEVEEKEDD